MVYHMMARGDRREDIVHDDRDRELTVNDAYFRFVVDMGAPGPDRGKGGKYLILPPDYEGDL